MEKKTISLRGLQEVLSESELKNLIDIGLITLLKSGDK